MYLLADHSHHIQNPGLLDLHHDQDHCPIPSREDQLASASHALAFGVAGAAPRDQKHIFVFFLPFCYSPLVRARAPALATIREAMCILVRTVYVRTRTCYVFSAGTPFPGVAVASPLAQLMFG